MTSFSANLGFLWSDLSLPNAIAAAGAAGFDAVECHWPYNTPAEQTRQALDETGLTMLALNTSRGMPGESGLASLPGRETEARSSIDQAIAYAAAIGTPNVHVMAGIGSGPSSESVFMANLEYACSEAEARGITVLIEPLNGSDFPGYFLRRTTHAETIISSLTRPNLKLMFDCYHVQISEGNVTRRLEWLMPITGHIQFASVPERAEPDSGELDYHHVFGVIADLGWTDPLGAEYRPATTVEAGLGWMKTLGS